MMNDQVNAKRKIKNEIYLWDLNDNVALLKLYRLYKQWGELSELSYPKQKTFLAF